MSVPVALSICVTTHVSMKTGRTPARARQARHWPPMAITVEVRTGGRTGGWKQVFQGGNGWSWISKWVVLEQE